jgi:hypothetical protein
MHARYFGKLVQRWADTCFPSSEPHSSALPGTSFGPSILLRADLCPGNALRGQAGLGAAQQYAAQEHKADKHQYQ